MKERNRVSAQKRETAQNRGDLNEWLHQMPQVLARHAGRRRQQIFWGRKNEGGTFRNDRDEPRGKTRTNIPESVRAWCDAHACFHTGDRSFQGGK